MATIAFDTLKFSKRLKDAGVPDKQAEAEAEALAEVFEVNLKDLASKDEMLSIKGDLKALEERLGIRINVVEERLGTRINALEERLGDKMSMLEQRMTIKLGGLMVIAVGAVATLVKLL